MSKVLVVEDAAFLNKAWVKKFKDKGLEVEVVNNKNEAVKTAEQVKPDLVVVDLPQKESEAAVKKIRENKWANHMPVMYLNSWHDEEVMLDYKSGLDEHLAYNWSLEEVVQKAKQKLSLNLVM